MIPNVVAPLSGASCVCGALLPPFATVKYIGARHVDQFIGYLTSKGVAEGLPVGTALDLHGSLLVADDVGKVIWQPSAIR